MASIERIAKNLREESIYVRNIEESLQIKFTILIVDRKSALCVELKDDTKQSAYDAMGLATYYTSKASVLSFSNNIREYLETRRVARTSVRTSKGNINSKKSQNAFN